MVTKIEAGLGSIQILERDLIREGIPTRSKHEQPKGSADLISINWVLNRMANRLSFAKSAIADPRMDEVIRQAEGLSDFLGEHSPWRFVEGTSATCGCGRTINCPLVERELSRQRNLWDFDPVTGRLRVLESLDESYPELSWPHSDRPTGGAAIAKAADWIRAGVVGGAAWAVTTSAVAKVKEHRQMVRQDRRRRTPMHIDELARLEIENAMLGPLPKAVQHSLITIGPDHYTVVFEHDGQRFTVLGRFGTEPAAVSVESITDAP